MTVEKFIRILGYVAYTALWSPVIVLALTITPIVIIGLYVRSGMPIGGAIDWLKERIMSTIQHDMEFIQTGKW